MLVLLESSHRTFIEKFTLESWFVSWPATRPTFDLACLLAAIDTWDDDLFIAWLVWFATCGRRLLAVLTGRLCGLKFINPFTIWTRPEVCVFIKFKWALAHSDVTTAVGVGSPGGI